MSIVGDCSSCMQNTTQSTRQEMGCGYEPLVPLELRRKRWRHRAYKGPAATLCAGYTTRLPEVLEVAAERLHWQKGSSGPLSDSMKAGLEILEGEAIAVEAWLLTPKDKGGGGT